MSGGVHYPTRGTDDGATPASQSCRAKKMATPNTICSAAFLENLQRNINNPSLWFSNAGPGTLEVKSIPVECLIKPKRPFAWVWS